MRRQFVTIHDLIHLRVPGVEGLKYKGYYAAARALVRRSGLVFTVSEASANDIRTWLRDDDVEIVNTRGGCSDAFTRDGDAHVEDEPYFLFVGNMRAHKNINSFLGALALVPVRGVVVVPVAELEECRTRAVRYGVADRLSLLSGVDDAELACLYRGAVALVFPSLHEGFGLPALESVRCGTPVLYWAGCPSVAEIVGADGEAVASERDAEAWAAAMSTSMISGADVAGDLAGAFTWEATAARVDAALGGALG
ncbi:glycosyltransferase family 4 protein [Microbacterium sp. RG1]|uniref:glycosyltransferase family 4 protein n=1 Tax=Microbacterium sp. RG1 TaxID=2489212 RepID=UPI0010CA52A7|nr:glycosyltransferase family 1 protein [Microbacterium sp. RG1]QCQ17049.1 glycosyltransferase family 1 protein [Microbacterium sp. RG1]